MLLQWRISTSRMCWTAGEMNGNYLSATHDRFSDASVTRRDGRHNQTIKKFFTYLHVTS